jgi:hypothetical protein
MKRFLTKYFVILSICSFSFLNTGLLGQGGDNAAAFLELGIGARAMAMGEAFVSVANDGTAFYWNPAGISLLQRAELTGMYASLFKSLERHFHIGFTRPLYGAGAISLNWIRLTVPEIPFYDPGNILETSTYEERIFGSSQAGGSWQELRRLGTVLTADPLDFSNFQNDAFIITLAKLNKIDVDFGWQYFVLPITVPVGVNIKFIRQSLFQKKSSGVGFDAGTMLNFGLDDLMDDSRLGKISFGFAMKDLFNTKITWDTDSRHADRIKRSWYLGTSYMQPIPSLNSQLLIAYALQRRFRNTHHVGTEYVYNNRLAIRFGLDDSEFAAGVGIRISLFHFDYTYKGHELGGSHRVSTFIKL